MKNLEIFIQIKRTLNGVLFLCKVAKKCKNDIIKQLQLYFKTRDIYKVCYSKGGINMSNMDKKAQKELEKGYEKAQVVLEDKDKLERLLQRTEKKLKIVPVAGSILAMVPTMVSLIRNYIKKEYTDIPVGTIIAVTSALIYFISPVDIIPDVLPGVGYVDDAAVFTACIKLVASDLDEYKKWREENNKNIEE